jgi:resuscitation-promoting factor RpfA
VSKSQDITSLFRRFGGNADSYQEIVSNDQARAAEQNWPMLGQRKPMAGAEAPYAKRVEALGERVAQKEVVIYKTLSQGGRAQPDVTSADRRFEAASAPRAPAAKSGMPWANWPAPSASAPTLGPAVPVAGAGVAASSLKGMFDRMAPREPEPNPVATPKKRPIKW